MAKLSKPNTVPVPDEVFDIAIRELTDSELRVLLVIINKTLRWNKTWDWIAETQFHKEGGLSDAAIYYALNGRETSIKNGKTHIYEGLIKKGYVLRKYTCAHCNHESIEFNSTCPNCKNGKTYKPYYALNLGDELVVHLKHVKKPNLSLAKKINPPIKNRLTTLDDSSNNVRTQETLLQETTTPSTDQTNTGLRIPIAEPKTFVAKDKTAEPRPSQKEYPDQNNKDEATKKTRPFIGEQTEGKSEENRKFSSHPIYNFFLAHTTQRIIDSIPYRDMKILGELADRRVPQNVIFEGIRESLKQFKPKYTNDKIRNLAWCEPFIYQLFDKVQSGTVDVPLTKKEAEDKLNSEISQYISKLNDEQISRYQNEGYLTSTNIPTPKMIEIFNKPRLEKRDD